MHALVEQPAFGSGHWMLYGASGYTGSRIAEAAVGARLRPVLAGRNLRRIAPLAERLDCPCTEFPLDDPHRVARHIARFAAVLNCAGPFSATAVPMMEACLAAGVHYLDVTGEIDVIEQAAARNHRAEQAGVVLMPAVGFDVVATDCLAVLLAEQLPHGHLLQLAFTGMRSVSRGTAKTMLQGLVQGGRVRRDGHIIHVPLAWKTRTIPFPGGDQLGVSVPWGDVASAWYSTGVPNIEVYLGTSRATVAAMHVFRWLQPVIRAKQVQRWISGAIDRWVRGPKPSRSAHARITLWGRLIDKAGRCVQAAMSTPGGYRFTVHAALECLGRVLAGQARPGFVTPAKAFGSALALSLPGVVMLQWPCTKAPGG